MNTSTSGSKGKKKILTIVVVLILLALVIIIDAKRRSAEDQLQKLSMRLEQLTGGNTEQSKALAKDIVTKLGKLVLLKTDIEPTVATVVDPTKLKEQNPAFYTNVQKDDVLIIYPDVAYLFRPSSNGGMGMIINTAPVSLQDQKTAGVGGAASSAPATK